MKSRGFTLIELVTIMVLIGILAVVAVPRISNSDFQALAFRDKTASALRYAQKTASSHRRLVCAAFTANSVTLQIAPANPASACTTNLLLPSGSNTVNSGSSSVIFLPDTATPAPLFFQPDGRISTDGAGTTLATLSLDIAGLTIPITGGAIDVR